MLVKATQSIYVFGHYDEVIHAIWRPVTGIISENEIATILKVHHFRGRTSIYKVLTQRGEVGYIWKTSFVDFIR